MKKKGKKLGATLSKNWEDDADAEDEPSKPAASSATERKITVPSNPLRAPSPTLRDKPPLFSPPTSGGRVISCTILAIFLDLPLSPSIQILTNYQKIPLNSFLGKSTVFTTQLTYFENESLEFYVHTSLGRENGRPSLAIFSSEPRKANEGLHVCIIPDKWGSGGIFNNYYNYNCKVTDCQPYLDLALALFSLAREDFNTLFLLYAKEIRKYSFSNVSSPNLYYFCRSCSATPLASAVLVANVLTSVERFSAPYLDFPSSEELVDLFRMEGRYLVQSNLFHSFLNLLKPSRLQQVLKACFSPPDEARRAVLELRTNPKYRQDLGHSKSERDIIRLAKAKDVIIQLSTSLRLANYLHAECLNQVGSDGLERKEEADEEDFRTSVMQSLVSVNLKEYRLMLNRFNEDDYFEEWKLFLTARTPPAIPRNEIVFSVEECAKTSANTEAVCIRMIEFIETSQASSVWVRPAIEQIVRYFTQSNKFVNVLKVISYNVKSLYTLQLFLPFITPVCNEDCISRLNWLRQQQEQQLASPTVQALLANESSLIFKFISDISENFRFEIKEELAKKKYWHIPCFCHFTDPTQNISIYKHLWNLLFECEAVVGDIRVKRKILASFSRDDNRDSIVFESISIPRCCDLAAELLFKSSLNDDFTKVSLTADLTNLVDKLDAGDVTLETLEVLGKHSQALHQLSKRDVPGMINRQRESIKETKNQWDILLMSLRVMRERTLFRRFSENALIKYEAEYESLSNLPIIQWTRPIGIDSHMKQQCERLVSYRKTLVFSFLWDQEMIGSNLEVTENSLFDSWITYVQEYNQEFLNLTGSITAKAVSVKTLQDIFGENFRTQVINPTEEMRRQVKNVRDEQLRGVFTRGLNAFQQAVHDELNEAGNLTRINADFTTLSRQIRDCLHAVTIQNDSKALAGICSTYQLQGVGVDLNERFSACEQTISMGEFFVAFSRVATALSPLQAALPKLFFIFREVLVQQGLLQFLLSFPDIGTLNKRIDAKQGEDIEDDVGELLTALRLIGQTILPHPYCSELRQRIDRNVINFANFVYDCGPLYQALLDISGKITRIQNVLQQATDERQIIASVKNLLLTGCLVISVKHRKVICFGVQQDGSDIPPGEFEALPSQLLLTSGVEVTSDLSLVDARLPENISRPEDRERYVQRFTVLFDRLINLSKVIQALCETGFPDFQENRLTIPCIIRIPQFDQKIREYENLLDRWMQAYALMRQEFPNITCFTRIQLVEWMHSFRAIPCDINALHDALVSVGCPAGDGTVNIIRETYQQLHNNNEIRAVFHALNLCFERCFQVAKLVGKSVPQAKVLEGIYGSNPNSNPNPNPNPNFNTANVNSSKPCDARPVRLLRLAGEVVEEEVVGLHIGQHKRVPFPFEILFCSADTGEVDLIDFVERWANFYRVAKRKDNCASFYLIHPNRISFDKQHRLARRISELQKSITAELGSDLKIQLFLVVEANESSYVTNVFQREEVVVNKHHCIQARGNIKLALRGQKVYVVRSASCGSGKTRAIIEQLVDPVNNPERLHAQITIDKSPLNNALKRLSRERPLKDPEGIILHFNIGHMVSKQAVNVFLLEYVLLGCWRDEKGATFPRHSKDTIVVELCNTGYRDERDRIGITKQFTQLEVDLKISPNVYAAIPSPHHGSTQVFVENPTDIPLEAVLLLSEGKTRWISAKTRLSIESGAPFKVTLQPNQSLMACFSHEEDGRTPKSVDVIWHSPAFDADSPSGTFAQKSETMLYRYQYDPTEGIGARLLVVLYNLVMAGITQMISHDQVISEHGEVVLPVPSTEELDRAVRFFSEENSVPEENRETYVRRFFKFASSQLNNFCFSFGFWKEADGFAEDRDSVLMLTFYYAKMLIMNCQDLGKPTMMPQDITNPKDDISRFQGMENFEKWMERPYIVCTPKSFRVISTSNFNPLDKILEEVDRDSYFRQWLETQSSVLESYDRQKVQFLCDQLGNCPYSADSVRPPLKDLLELVGCFEGAAKVIDVIDLINEQNISGTMSLIEIVDYVLEAVNWLNSKVPASSYLDLSDPVSRFKQVGEQFLRKIFGGSDSKPGFRLTVGSVLRMIAIQIRNTCQIPICIVGETGCGKTEMLSFIAKLVGAHYYVINVQEGMNEDIFYKQLQPVISEAVLHPDIKITCVLDEANATSHVWAAKDMLCDHILNGLRLPSNINFVVIMNPAKYKSENYLSIEREMNAGGLDFRVYQHITSTNQQEIVVPARDLVYQVNTAPETLYSLVWDFGTSFAIRSKKSDLPEVVRLIDLDANQEMCSDELQVSLSMTEWLVRKLKEDSQDLIETFRAFGDNTEGDAYFWKPFKTLLVELMLGSQDHIRRAFGNESSAVSLRDMRQTCYTIYIIFKDFYGAAVELKPEIIHSQGQSAHFHLLTSAIHCALVRVYCLRLDTARRLAYLQDMHLKWGLVRRRFPLLEPSFITAPPPAPATCEMSALYRSFDELALMVVSDLLNEGDIAPNQALKENTISMLLAIWMRSTLFIVGRPGSTKSRSLELLCEASTSGSRKRSFISVLGLVIHKFVVQCSPDTTSEHVNSQARRAALAQYNQSRMTEEKHQCVLVLEEVGATIGSRHNPLMSLHQLIDHGAHCVAQGRHITEHLPIIGISNYRLDASKMGRGSAVHRGNPAVDDLAMTARTILHHIDRSGNTDYTRNFAQAFSYNILGDETYTWYHGMRDFYASVSTIQRLLRPTKEFITNKRTTGRELRTLTSHIVRWSMLINLQGYPDPVQEAKLLKTMIQSFGLPQDTSAVWKWQSEINEAPMNLCDACCRMQLYLKLVQYRSQNPNEVITCETISSIHSRHAKELTFRGQPCEFFNTSDLPAMQIIAYSLWETSSRHQMIFTKANAALPLLFSLNLVRKEESIIIFQSIEGEQATSTSERVQQMMRIKACLREGKTLILVKSRHLYESLLDATNVHYVRDYSGDGEVIYKTMLSMAGVTQPAFLKPTFRCIVLEDRDQLRSSVMPPFINRFSKTTLTFASILTPQQKLIREFLMNQSKVTIPLPEGRTAAFNIFYAIAPGFNDFSIDSAAFVYESEQEALESIAFCFSRKNLRRIQLGLVTYLPAASIKPELIKLKTRWIESGANKSFKDSAVQLLQTNTYVEEDDEEQEEPEEVEEEVEEEEGKGTGEEQQALEKASHLMILTEQLQVDPADLFQSLSAVVREADETASARMVPADIQLLNQMTAVSVATCLNHLKRELVTKDESLFAVFVLDSEASTTVNLDTFTYIVSSIKGIGLDRKRVILVVTYKDTLTTDIQKFSYVFHEDWVIMNTDEIVSRPLGEQLLPAETLGNLENESAFLDEILSHDLFCALVLQGNTLTCLCQTLSDPVDVQQKIAAVRKLLTSGNSILRKTIFDLCIESIQVERISFEKWSTIAFQKAKLSSDSLRSIYLNYLASFTARVIFPVLELLFRFGTLYCLDRNPLLDEITASILRVLQPPFDVSHCLAVESLPTTSSSSDLAVVELMKFKKTVKVKFPFSPQIAVLLTLPNSSVAEALRRIVEEIPSQLVQDYIDDVLRNGFNIASHHLDLFRAILQLQFNEPLDSIGALHDFLTEKKKLFQACRRFVSCGVEPFAVNQFLEKGNRTKKDLIELTKNILNIPLLSRTELLRTILQDDPEVPWKIYRAAGLAFQLSLTIEDPLHQTTMHEHIRIALNKFLDDIGQGIEFTFTHSPEIAKFFIFELFEGEQADEQHKLNEQYQQDLIFTLTFLSRTNNLQIEEESIACCVGFLLVCAFECFIFQEFPLEPLESFFQSDPQRVIFGSHCLINALNSEITVINQCWIQSQGLPEQSWVKKLCSSTLCIVTIWLLLQGDFERNNESETLQQILMDLMAKNRWMLRDLILYSVRQLTTGGTVDIESAIARLRDCEFLPKEIITDPILNEIIAALQKESPLMAIPQFSDAISAISEKALQLPNCEVRIANLNPAAHSLAVASIIANISPKEIPNFDVFKEQEFQRNNHQRLLSSLETATKSNKLPATAEVREVMLHGLALLLSQQPHATIILRNIRQSLQYKDELRAYRVQIEDNLVPKCPRCSSAFIDWAGCFSVYCPCGCSFCGVCLIDCGNDAHAHVQSIHGAHSFPFEKFQQEFGARATQKISAIMATVPVHLSDSLADELPRILQGNGFHIRAENIVARRRNAPGANNHDNNMLAVSTRLLFDMFNLIANTLVQLEGNNNVEVLSWEKNSENMNKCLEDIKNALFPDADSLASAYQWLHAAFNELLTLSNENIYFNTSMDAQRHADHILSQFPPDQLIRRFTNRIDRKYSHILSELTFDETFQRNSIQPERLPFASVFLYRSNFYMDQFQEHIITNNGEFPLFYNLISRKKTLSRRNMETNLRIIHFISDLSEYCQKIGLSRELAERSSFDSIVAQIEHLSSRRQSFEEDFRRIFPKVLKYECDQNFHQKWAHLLQGFNEDTKVAMFLPRKDGLGLGTLARSLYHGREGDAITDWTGLGNMQNEIVDALTKGNHAAIQDTQELSPYEASIEDIITCDTDTLLTMLYRLFLVPSFQPKLSSDLPLIEFMIRYGSLKLLFFPKLLPELPDHKYPKDGFSALFDPLEMMLILRRKEFEPLPGNLMLALSKLIQEVPDTIEPIFDFVVLAVKQLTTFQDSFPEFVRRINFTIPRTKEQLRGQHILMSIPAVRADLKVSHLRSLIGLCWDEKVHISANEPLPDECSLEEFNLGFQFVKDSPQYHEIVPQLMTELRALAMARLQSPLDPGFAQSFVMDALPDDLQDRLREIHQNELVELNPLTYPLKHFGSIYTSAKDLLGDLEVNRNDVGSNTVNNDTNDKEIQIISSSIMRQFLNHHEIEGKGGGGLDLNVRSNLSNRRQAETFVSRQEEKAALEFKEDLKEVAEEREVEIVWSQRIGTYEF